MDLDTYIRTTGVTEASIAIRARCAQSTVNKVRNGLGNPTFGLLRRISEATGYIFRPFDFLPSLPAAPSASTAQPEPAPAKAEAAE